MINHISRNIFERSDVSTINRNTIGVVMAVIHNSFLGRVVDVVIPVMIMVAVTYS